MSFLSVLQYFLQAGTGAVARSWQSKLRDMASIKDFGARGDGVTDDSAAITNALQSGAQFIYVPPGTYAVSSNISASITTNVTFYGNGSIVYVGATNNQNPLIAIETNGNSITVDGISFNGSDKVAAGLRIYNTAAWTANTLPNCTVSNCSFASFKMNITGIWNDGVFVAGSFQLVTIANNRIRLITRAAGTGTPGSTGTTGITVSQYSSTQFVRECLHYGNQYSDIIGGDLVGSANNVDYDGFKFFSPNPSTDSGQYLPSTLTSFGNVFRNCRGRAMKIQAIGSARDETIIRDSDYTILGGSVEINFQYGVGSVSNCQFIYRPYNAGASSPIQTGLALVSFYQGADYNEDTGGAIVDGIQVLSSIGAGIGSKITYILDARVGAGVADPAKPLVSLSNVSVNKNAIDWIAGIGYGASSYGVLSLTNITVPGLTYSAVATNGTDTNFDIVATNLMNIDGLSTPANAKPFVTTTAGASVAYGGMISGALNQGFLQTYNRGADFNGAPMLTGAALADPQNDLGGAASVQSVYLANEGSHTFERRWFNSSRGLIVVAVSYDYTSQGVMACGSNQVHVIAAHASNVFAASTTGTNPDTLGKLNLWFTGGTLSIKNRLGDAYSVTVTFIG